MKLIKVICLLTLLILGLSIEVEAETPVAPSGWHNPTAPTLTTVKVDQLGRLILAPDKRYCKSFCMEYVCTPLTKKIDSFTLSCVQRRKRK